MLIVMQSQATTEQVKEVVHRIESMGLDAHPMPGSTRTAIGITGNTAAIDPSRLTGLAGVREMIRVTKPFKLASREMQVDDSRVAIGPVTVEPKSFVVIAGPCSVESEEIMLQTAEFLLDSGVSLLRAGAFKPRTSPYSFQGLEHEGLRRLESTRNATGVCIVTEVMEPEQVDAVAASADVVQIGTRNMQNFPLLKRVGKCGKPVLLKRGMSATLEEWLMAAEYILAGGNKDVILCERGVRTFANHTRNTLDLSVVPCVKDQSHLPVLVDPSHGTGRRDFVIPMALASLAAGADGIMVEIHPDPEQAVSDGAQTMNFDQFTRMMQSLRQIAAPLGRTIC